MNSFYLMSKSLIEFPNLNEFTKLRKLTKKGEEVFIKKLYPGNTQVYYRDPKTQKITGYAQRIVEERTGYTGVNSTNYQRLKPNGDTYEHYTSIGKDAYVNYKNGHETCNIYYGPQYVSITEGKVNRVLNKDVSSTYTSNAFNMSPIDMEISARHLTEGKYNYLPVKRSEVNDYTRYYLEHPKDTLKSSQDHITHNGKKINGEKVPVFIDDEGQQHFLDHNLRVTVPEGISRPNLGSYNSVREFLNDPIYGLSSKQNYPHWWEIKDR